MLGELALLVRFAKARRGVDDSRWREERAKRLARAVEVLSGGRIAGDYADRLARAIIYYAEGQKKYAKKNIESLAKEVDVSKDGGVGHRRFYPKRYVSPRQRLR